MASIQFNVEHTGAFQDISFSLEGVDSEITDAEAIDLANRVKGSDFVARVLGTENIALEPNLNIFTARIIDPNA